MTTEGQIDLVIFDCDGVLVDSERLINRIESRLVSRVGIDLLPDEARATFKGHTVGEIVAIIEARAGALLSDEVVYHLPGKHLGGGTLQGRAALFNRIRQATSVLDERPSIRVQAVAGFGEWVLSVERFRARRGARILDQDVCVVWRVAGARCVEMWARCSDQALCDRFWLGQ